MAYSTIINDLISEQLLNMHVAYIAKILNTSNGKAKIQPLGKFKQYGHAAQAYAPIDKVPIANSAKYKIGKETITYVENKDADSVAKEIATLEPISKGDIVLCVCCDRNIAAALNGENATPPSGSSHNMSNSVIVAIL